MATKAHITRRRASEDAQFIALLGKMNSAQLAAALVEIRALVSSQVAK